MSDKKISALSSTSLQPASEKRKRDGITPVNPASSKTIKDFYKE